MKKISAVNLNFILIIPFIIFLLLFAFYCSTQFDFNESYSKLNQLEDYDGKGLATHVLVLVQIIYVDFPIINAVFLLFFSGIARLVYGSSKTRVTAYRGLMTIVYLGLIFLGIEIPFFFSNNFIMISILEILLLAILIVNMRNTYSDRVRN